MVAAAAQRSLQREKDEEEDKVLSLPSSPPSGQNENICTGSIPAGAATSWSYLVCNEGLNLVNTLAHGLGNDMYWPPSIQDRDFSYDDVVEDAGIGGCGTGARAALARAGLYGLPSEVDVWGKWEKDYYGGKHIEASSNIVFSNGMLDPWSSAGVLDNISSSLLATQIPLGGHHLDLMFSSPKSAGSGFQESRALEEASIRRWMRERKERMTEKGGDERAEAE